MYAYIRGTIAEKGMDAVTVEAAGVGYHILVGSRTLSELPPVGEPGLVYTQLIVREDAMTLYGFSRPEEKQMFLRMIAISNIGPKVAMNILSAMTPTELALAVVSEDVRALSRISGVGKKTAERLILELRGTIGNEELTGRTDTRQTLSPGQDAPVREAIEALIALGYSSTDAARAIAALDTQGMTVQQMIVGALRGLDRL